MHFAGRENAQRLSFPYSMSKPRTLRRPKCTTFPGDPVQFIVGTIPIIFASGCCVFGAIPNIMCREVYYSALLQAGKTQRHSRSKTAQREATQCTTLYDVSRRHSRSGIHCWSHSKSHFAASQQARTYNYRSAKKSSDYRYLRTLLRTAGQAHSCFGQGLVLRGQKSRVLVPVAPGSAAGMWVVYVFFASYPMCRPLR